MTVLLALALAAGVLLLASPLLWPRMPRPAAAERDGPLLRLVEEAGLTGLRPRVIIALAGVGAALGGAIAWLVTGVAVIAAAAALAGAALPWIALRSRRARRLRARRGLWPDVCDHLVSAVRAGMSMPDAVASLAHTAPAALRPACVAFARDLAASGGFESSLDALKARFADPMGDRIVETVRMARQVGGGETTEVLRALSASVRADVALRGEVEARQSWVRGAAVIGLVAPWIILVLLSLRPEGAVAYASPQGIAVVVGGGIVSIVGYRLMIRAGRLPEPRRWFG